MADTFLECGAGKLHFQHLLFMSDHALALSFSPPFLFLFCECADIVGAAAAAVVSDFFGLPRAALTGGAVMSAAVFFDDVAAVVVVAVTEFFAGLPLFLGISAAVCLTALGVELSWEDLACILSEPLGARVDVTL